ncbi:MAG: hypothetical protein OHK0022_26860 [Roseiflexaceae bacterium]
MTTTTVTIQDAQHQLLEILKLVAAGNEVILTDGQQPRARIVPIQPNPAQRVPGLHLGNATMSPDFDAPLPEEFWTGPI